MLFVRRGDYDARMDQTTQVTVASLSSRQVNGSNGPFTAYEVIDSNNTKWRAKKNVFDQAALLIGQTVSFVGYAKQNGDYTNYYVNAIVGGVPAEQAQTAPAQAAPAPANDFEEQKKLSIHRQCAGKVAAQISKNADEFWSNVTDLVHYFGTGETPAANAELVTAAQAANTPAQATPAGYPQPQTDDDIPFS